MEKTIKELIKLAEDFKNLSQKYNGWTCQDYVFEEEGKNFLFHCYCYFSEDFNSFVRFDDNNLCFIVHFNYRPRVELNISEGDNEAMLREVLERYKKFFNQLKKDLKEKFNNKLIS